MIAKRSVSSRVDCVLECLGDQRCVSYNFQESSVNGKHACELSNHTKVLAGVDLKARSGYSYYESIPQVQKFSGCNKSPSKRAHLSFVERRSVMSELYIAVFNLTVGSSGRLFSFRNCCLNINSAVLITMSFGTRKRSIGDNFVTPIRLNCHSIAR